MSVRMRSTAMPLVLEVGQSTDEEGGGSRAAFVGQGLDVGVAGMVVHGYVEEVETEAGPR